MSIGQNTAAAEKLTSYLERIEHLLDEIDGLKDDLKDLKTRAKDEGFNVAAMLRLVAIRRDKKRANQENELLNDLVLYAHATGIPLDIATIEDGPVRGEGTVPGEQELATTSGRPSAAAPDLTAGE